MIKINKLLATAAMVSCLGNLQPLHGACGGPGCPPPIHLPGEGNQVQKPKTFDDNKRDIDKISALIDKQNERSASLSSKLLELYNLLSERNKEFLYPRYVLGTQIVARGGPDINVGEFHETYEAGDPESTKERLREETLYKAIYDMEDELRERIVTIYFPKCPEVLVRSDFWYYGSIWQTRATADHYRSHRGKSVMEQPGIKDLLVETSEHTQFSQVLVNHDYNTGNLTKTRKYFKPKKVTRVSYARDGRNAALQDPVRNMLRDPNYINTLCAKYHISLDAIATNWYHYGKARALVVGLNENLRTFSGAKTYGNYWVPMLDRLMFNYRASSDDILSDVNKTRNTYRMMYQKILLAMIYSRQVPNFEDFGPIIWRRCLMAPLRRMNWWWTARRMVS